MLDYKVEIDQDKVANFINYDDAFKYFANKSIDAMNSAEKTLIELKDDRSTLVLYENLHEEKD